jgi:hypothetical protein
MKPYQILNENVRIALRQDPRLWAPFVLLHDGYDDEIEPLHNPQWVVRAKERELVKLERARVAVEMADRVMQLVLSANQIPNEVFEQVISADLLPNDHPWLR